MTAWTNGSETIQVPDGIPAGHLASLGWTPLQGATAQAQPKGTKRTRKPSQPAVTEPAEPEPAGDVAFMLDIGDDTTTE